MEPFETSILKISRDNNGILHSEFKKDSVFNSHILADAFNQIIDHVNGEKVCWKLDATYILPLDKEAREIAFVKLPLFVKALGIVTNRPLSVMIANIFFSLKPPPYPAKIFSTEKEAVAWLKNYL